mgnify:CR=1 FL=1
MFLPKSIDEFQCQFDPHTYKSILGYEHGVSLGARQVFWLGFHTMTPIHAAFFGDQDVLLA